MCRALKDVLAALVECCKFEVIALLIVLRISRVKYNFAGSPLQSFQLLRFDKGDARVPY